MRRLSLRLGCVAALVLAIGPVLAVTASAAPASAPDHVGRYLVDDQGRALTVHGFNMVAKLPPYTAQSVGFGDDDARFLADNGFNVVRLGIMWGAVEPEPGAYNEQYLDEIAETVRTLAKHRIYTLIDFHQDSYHESLGGQGFPEWAVDTTVAGAVPVPSVGEAGPANPAQYVAWDNFWANKPAPDGVAMWDRFAQFWQHVAQRFRDDPWVIGYDLMNEPIPGSQSPLCINPVACPHDATLGRFYQHVIPQLRKVDAHHLVWYEPNIFAGAGGAQDIDHGGDDKAVLSFHNYCAITALTSGQFEKERQPVCPATENVDYDISEKQAARNGDALVMTEFGSTPSVREIERVAAGADARHIGWTEWTYHNTGHTNFAGEYSIVRDPNRPPEGDNVNDALLRATARAYPQVIAGTPGTWAFDSASREFTLDYTVARLDGHGEFPAGSETVIAAPDAQYPDGYSVTLDGARVVSADGPRLRIASCPGAERVQVGVKPGSGVRGSCPRYASSGTGVPSGSTGQNLGGGGSVPGASPAAGTGTLAQTGLDGNLIPAGLLLVGLGIALVWGTAPVSARRRTNATG